MCASTWAKVAPKRSSLGPSCAMLDPSWAEVKGGTKLDEVRALLAQVGPKVERMLQPCWIETVNCDDVVPVCKRCKSRQSRTLFSGSCASWTDCPFESIGSPPKLSRLGTFDAGGFDTVWLSAFGPLALLGPTCRSSWMLLVAWACPQPLGSHRQADHCKIYL